jgi:hypothetical protein
LTTQFPILKTEGDSKVHLLGENPEPHEDQQDFANLLEIPTTNETVDAVATNDDSGLLAEIDKTDINLLLAELESSGSIAASLGDFDLIADGIGSKLDNAVLDGSTQQIQQPQSIANLLNASGSLVGQFQTSGDRASIQLTASNQSQPRERRKECWANKPTTLVK